MTSSIIFNLLLLAAVAFAWNSEIVPRRSVLTRSSAALLGSFSNGSCSLASAEASDAAQVNKPGLIWHKRKRQVLPAVPGTLMNLIHAEWLNDICSQQSPIKGACSNGIVCISERHDDWEHHVVQLKCILSLRRALAGKKEQLAVGMECFQRSHDRHLQKFINNPGYDFGELMEDTDWDNTWGYDILHYAPLLKYAKTHALPVFGLSPDSDLIDAVRINGLEAVPHSLLSGVLHRDALHYQQFREFHQLTNSDLGTSPDRLAHFQRLYLLRCVRDEFMAESVSLQSNKQEGKAAAGLWTAVLAGETHILNSNTIPERTQRRFQSTKVPNRGVYTVQPKTAIFPIQIAAQDAASPRMADYVWFVENEGSFQRDKVNLSPFRTTSVALSSLKVKQRTIIGGDK